jgi:N-acetylmuramic acid 6-phosphate etherase
LFGIICSMEAQKLSTEQSAAEYTALDTWSNADILTALVKGQERAIAAVKAAIPEISRAADLLSANLRQGGNLYYAGAGTSIRIGVQDGSELPATFGMLPERIRYLIAGGRAAMFDTLADAEDDAEEGGRAAAPLGKHDTLIAIAASGTTPYTISAATTARKNGATVIAIVNNANSPLGKAADVEIALNSGPEVIAGSTRMGAGTAQKAAVNLLSTLTHVKLGAIHNGMMVNVLVGNAKLRKRAIGIITSIADVDAKRAAAALEAAGNEVKPAILMCSGARTVGDAKQKLRDADGSLRKALQSLKRNPS